MNSEVKRSSLDQECDDDESQARIETGIGRTSTSSLLTARTEALLSVPKSRQNMARPEAISFAQSRSLSQGQGRVYICAALDQDEAASSGYYT